MYIRKTTAEDLTRICEIYDIARQFMRETGNPTQWKNYPSVELLQSDIDNGISYVIINNDVIVGTFVFIIGDDPTYSEIDGEWLNDRQYGTIHRIASDGSVKGIADECLKFCLSKIKNIRIDTHADNSVMLNWITRAGFKYCGIIRVSDGTPRNAFQIVYDS